MKHLKYIGKDKRLFGETALVRDDPESRSRGVLAQFDNTRLPEAFKWWPFYSYEFEEREELEAGE